MTNREIYGVALSILGEQTEDCADYEERAPHLIGAVVSEYAKRDQAFRLANGLETAEAVSLQQGLDGVFPLSERFAVAVCYHLAAMLIERENPDFATRCFSHAEASVERILQEQTPAAAHAIREMR